MSEITVVLIEDNEVFFVKAHYRFIIDLINSNFKKTLELKQKKQKLDAGYLLIDLDKKLMLDCQSGFSIEHLKPKIKLNIIKNWYYLNHPNW
jgi:hypothetical protein